MRLRAGDELPAAKRVGRAGQRADPLRGQQPALDGGGDAARYLVLHGEYVAQLAVEAIRPVVPAGRGIDELGADAQPLARATYAAFEHIAHAQLAPRFADWLGVAQGLEWLEIGCGTGALSATILARCSPSNLIAIDSSEGFVAKARAMVADARAHFRLGDAGVLGLETASHDAVVSALVLNFQPDRPKALAEMRRVARRGGTVGFYVWDYPGGGMELMQAFWKAAATLDPAASALSEDRRFPFCTPDGLVRSMHDAGLPRVDCVAIEVPTLFRDFDDYWRPFTLGAGPAPCYCASLAPGAQQRLRERLRAELPCGADGSIALKARAWAVKASVD